MMRAGTAPVCIGLRPAGEWSRLDHDSRSGCPYDRIIDLS
jgi:hypothetical protein